MKQYSKDEISKIVSNCAATVMQNNSENFINESTRLAEEAKNDNELLVKMFILLYREVQQNCNDTITEVLSRLFNE